MCIRDSVYVLAFRNAPLLVLVYFTTYVFPFELNLGGWNLPFPDWIKVVIGLGLPASANVAEIFRGAIQSIPEAQWEAAQSLAFRRSQIFRMIVLPQCVRRMLPSWMNLYASITMSCLLYTSWRATAAHEACRGVSPPLTAQAPGN